MSSTAFTFEHASSGAMGNFTGESRTFAMEKEHSGGADSYVREAIQSARSLWALSTVTRLMMAREQCLRTAQQNDGETQRIQELEASLVSITSSRLPSKTKSVVRERILEQIEYLQQRASA